MYHHTTFYDPANGKTSFVSITVPHWPPYRYCQYWKNRTL